MSEISNTPGSIRHSASSVWTLRKSESLRSLKSPRSLHQLRAEPYPKSQNRALVRSQSRSPIKGTGDIASIIKSPSLRSFAPSSHTPVKEYGIDEETFESLSVPSNNASCHGKNDNKISSQRKPPRSFSDLLAIPKTNVEKTWHVPNQTLILSKSIIGLNQHLQNATSKTDISQTLSEGLEESTLAKDPKYQDETINNENKHGIKPYQTSASIKRFPPLIPNRKLSSFPSSGALFPPNYNSNNLNNLKRKTSSISSEVDKIKTQNRTTPLDGRTPSTSLSSPPYSSRPYKRPKFEITERNIKTIDEISADREKRDGFFSASTEDQLSNDAQQTENENLNISNGYVSKYSEASPATGQLTTIIDGLQTPKAGSIRDSIAEPKTPQSASRFFSYTPAFLGRYSSRRGSSLGEGSLSKSKSIIRSIASSSIIPILPRTPTSILSRPKQEDEDVKKKRQQLLDFRRMEAERKTRLEQEERDRIERERIQREREERERRERLEREERERQDQLRREQERIERIEREEKERRERQEREEKERQARKEQEERDRIAREARKAKEAEENARKESEAATSAISAAPVAPEPSVATENPTITDGTTAPEISDSTPSTFTIPSTTQTAQPTFKFNFGNSSNASEKLTGNETKPSFNFSKSSLPLPVTSNAPTTSNDSSNSNNSGSLNFNFSNTAKPVADSSKPSMFNFSNTASTSNSSSFPTPVPLFNNSPVNSNSSPGPMTFSKTPSFNFSSSGTPGNSSTGFSFGNSSQNKPVFSSPSAFGNTTTTLNGGSAPQPSATPSFNFNGSSGFGNGNAFSNNSNASPVTTPGGMFTFNTNPSGTGTPSQPPPSGRKVMPLRRRLGRPTNQ